MLDSAYKTIKKYNMLSKGDVIVVGVSGGPDSMTLLHLLNSLKHEYSLTIYAAHLNHMLRGKESDEDTEYVREFCQNLNINCIIKYIDVKALAAEKRLTLEEAGREARYGLFMEVANKFKATKIALAHNINDQAETVLMRIMRGTGLDGLCGINPVRDGLYIRPLIYTSRTDIEKYCIENNIKPRIDSTNLKPIYARNKIRLELIPYIKKNFNSNIEYSLSTMADILSEENDFIDNYSENIFINISSIKKGIIFINIESLNNLHSAIKRRVIRKAIEKLKGDLIGIEKKHIESILSIADACVTGLAVDLPGYVKAKVSYGFVEIYKKTQKININFNHDLVIPGKTKVPEINGMMEADIIDAKHEYYYENKLVKYFDYDKIKGNLTIRSRAEGDYIVPLGMKGRKKIKELFIDSKIPRDERNNIPLIACGNEVLWVVGLKVSDNYKIDNKTKKILMLKYYYLGGIYDAR